VRGERGLIARHAGTVLVGQLAVMAFGVTDTIVAGRYSEDALAALSVGAAIFVSVYVSLMGVLQALLPVWAELHGGGRGAEVGRSVRQSLYLAVLAFGLAPALLFRLFSTLSQGLGKPQLVTWLQLASLAIKLPLSVWFTFGGAGLPAMGLVGCGWATLAVNWAMLGCAVWLLRASPFYRGYRLWQPIEKPDWAQIGQFARLGVPAGLAVLVEVTSFTLMALFIARLGTTAAAAHQIAANLLAVAYMVPLSLAIATSARVSFWLGAGDPALARRACRTGFELTVLCALLFALAMGGLRFQLAAVYSDKPAVIALAGALLLVVALYHFADALQTLCVFVLRCYRVTLAPLAIYCTLLWAVGLGGSYLLAYRGLGPWPAMQSPLAFWIMGAAALTVTALLFGALLRWTMAHRVRG